MDSCADTIAAVSTAPGRAGVAVVRVSGPDAFAVGERVASRKPVPGRVLFTSFAFDSGLLLAFKAPHSYTGEDVVELQCHGGFVAPRRVLEACLRAGARLAERGEFTRRAFANGKVTYEEAEGVIDLIDAKTDRAADAALSRSGTAEARGLYDAAIDLSAAVEHSLDVSEDELPPEFFAGLAARADALADSVRGAARRIRERRILRDGALAVIAGPPNAGKSSLLNALLGRDRAIVSATPGTTRDTIEEWLDLDGWPVRLVDTAGLRAADDEIEAEGVRRSEALMARADIVLMLEPAEEGATGDDRQPTVVAIRDNLVRVSSKCDLARGSGLNVSSATGEGLDDLRAAIVSRLEALADAPGAAEGDSGAERRLAALSAAESDLRKASGAEDPVLFANAVRSACEKLGDLAGATWSEDMLDRLFSRFCVGK